MLTAIDTDQEMAITGRELQDRAGCSGGATEEHRANHFQQTSAEEPRFRCICCDNSLAYQGDSATTLLEWFVHEDGACVSDGNMSMAHRVGQELVAMALHNRLLVAPDSINIDLERRIGAGSGFVIADVRVTEPSQLAVEVVHLSSELSLRRRLQTLFAQGYAAMIVVVTTGELTATRLERHLGKIGAIRVGRVNPQALKLEMGSVVTPKEVDLHSTRWDRVPAYLS